MDDIGQLTDAADQEWEHCMRLQEQEQWLRDQHAQIEYRSWLDLINALNSKDSTWDATQQTPVAVTSNPHPKVHTSLAVSN